MLHDQVIATEMKRVYVFSGIKKTVNWAEKNVVDSLINQ